MQRPIVLICLAFMLGLVAQEQWALPMGWWFAVASLPLIVWLGMRQRHGATTREWGPALVLLVALGALRFDFSSQEVRFHLDATQRMPAHGVREVTGRVTDVQRSRAPNARFDLTHATFTHDGETFELPAKVRVSVASGELDIDRVRYGDRLRVQGAIYPVGQATLPHRQSFEDYLAAEGVAASVYVRDASQVMRLQQGAVGWHAYPLLLSRRLRDAASEVIEANVPGAAGALVQAMLLAQRERVPDELLDAFRRTGLAHLLALSGLHVSALVMGVMWLTGRAPLRRKQRALLALAFAIFFLTMVGWRPPIFRATVLGVCLMLGNMLERKSDGLNLLALSAFIQLQIQPLLLYQLSFQLSHLIVLFIILAGKAAEPLLEQVRAKPLRWLLHGILISVISSLAAAPLLGNAFGQIPLASFLGNLPAVPLAGLLVVAGLVYTTLGLLIPPLAAALSTLLWLPAEALIWVVRAADIVPPLTVQRSGTTALLLYYPVMIFLLIPAKRFEIHFGGRGNIKWLAALTGIALYVIVDVSTTLPRPMRIQFLALGQSDCIVIHCPHGEVILVDGGRPSRDPNSYSPLLDHLRHERIRRVHLMINTHPDADHIGDLPAVLDAIPVDLVLTNGQRVDSDIAATFEAAMARSQATVVTAQAGTEISGLRDVTLEVLYPPRLIGPPTGTPPNDWSVVARLVYRDFELLLTGDITFATELELVQAGTLLDSDILKVPHHGSRWSSSDLFLDHVTPRVAVIQVGRNNYGHPAPDVLDRLQDAGAHVLTTKRHGTVEVITDGRTYRVMAMRGEAFLQGNAMRRVNLN